MFLASVGYEAQLHGHLDYDPVKMAFTRFDTIALGDMYGEASENAWLYRPGRNPVGFAFELVSGAVPAERLPPRGNMTPRDLERYLCTKSAK